MICSLIPGQFRRERQTRVDKFHLANGSDVSCDLMNLVYGLSSFSYCD